MLWVAECMHVVPAPSGAHRFEATHFQQLLGGSWLAVRQHAARATGARKHAWRALWCSLATALALACWGCDGV